MVSHHAVAGFELAVRVLAGGFGGGEDEGAQGVGVVIVVLALQDGGEALQAHAGVDGRARQGGAGAGRAFLVLHEHEVPDFDEAVAVFIRGAGGAAWDFVAVVVENFRAGAAGAGVAHFPEIVVSGDADDFVVPHAGDFFPEVSGLVVGVVDGDEEFVFREAKILGQQGPGVEDGLFLEVVAEGEVTQHLEEGVVAGGVADVVEVVVLAAGADAFLAGGGADVVALLLPGEQVLERYHAGTGE